MGFLSMVGLSSLYHPYRGTTRPDGDVNLPSLMAVLADKSLPKHFYNMAYTNLFGID